MFESVDRLTDGQTDGRPLDSHPISSPYAFGTGELKIKSGEHSGSIPPYLLYQVQQKNFKNGLIL